MTNEAAGGFTWGTAPGCIERVDLATGKIERVVDRVADDLLSAPNDLVFDSAGGLWFTDFGRILAREKHRSGLYYLPPGGAVREIVYGGLSFNGVGLAPDASAVYVADTFSARVLAFPLAAPGLLAEAPGLSHGRNALLATVPGDLGLDSLAITAAGRICVGTVYIGGIATVDPNDKSVSVAWLPDTTVTNIAFGGTDMRDAYITASGSGRLWRTRWPEPGLRLHFGQY
jgi:gluconolactonase